MPRSDTQFKPGQGGRPTGSKNKITKAYLEKLWDHFKLNGKDVLDRVCKDKPDVYLKLVAMLVPKDLDIKHSGDVHIELVSFLDVTKRDLE